MNICVFCSGQEVDGRYVRLAEELGKLVGEGGHSLVWGGSNTGLMRVVADAAQAAGSKLIGISVEFLREKARDNADEMFIAKDLAERKRLLAERSDGIVVLPGGTGTLDEATEIFELKKHDRNEKPIILLNFDGFYDGLKLQLERMKREGFIERPLEDFAFFASTPKEALDYLER